MFIFGDRGVGKTSLAHTAAFLHQDSGAEPVIRSCDGGSSFGVIIRDITQGLLGRNPLEVSRKSSSKVRAALSALSAETAREIEEGNVPLPMSVNEAVALLRLGAISHSTAPVVVLDEFERLASSSDRSLFGDLIKQLGDQDVPVKMLFCGVGGSLDDLLAGHASCYRHLAGIHLERLDFGAILEIVRGAADVLEIEMKDDYAYRIGAISDGFPHYAHLVGWNLFGLLIDEERRRVLAREFSTAVHRAALDVEPRLLQAYRRATEKYSDDYRFVLWAAAEHPDLRRRSSDIYLSYQKLCRALGQQFLDRDKFNHRLNALKGESHGQVLSGTRTGWYEFSEPMVRGYCRLKAEEGGFHLGLEYCV